jgi:predicted transposase/invertase (TIGR01784 family)
MLERRVKRKFHARCGIGEKVEITSNPYLLSLYSSQLKSGNIYSKLNKTVTISILDFEYLPLIEKMHSTFHISFDSCQCKHFIIKAIFILISYLIYVKISNII